MKQLNFRHFNTNRKKFTVSLARKKRKRLQKGQYYFVWYTKKFSAISDDSRSFRKISEDYRKFRRLPKMSEDYRGEIRKSSTPQVFQNTVAHGSKKRDYSPFEHRLKVHGPIFEEQIRIYNAKRLCVFHYGGGAHFDLGFEVSISSLARAVVDCKLSFLIEKEGNQKGLNLTTHSCF